MSVLRQMLTRAVALGLVGLLLAACAAIPPLIEREAGWIGVTAPAWQFQTRHTLREERTQNVMGKDVTVRITAHAGLWTGPNGTTMITAAVPAVEVFGLELNPVALMDVGQLAGFVLQAVAQQAQGALPFGVSELPELTLERDLTAAAPYATLTGNQFRVKGQGLETTVVLVKAKSRSDIVLILGLLPHPLRDADISAFEAAVASSQHDGAPPAQQ